MHPFDLEPHRFGLFKVANGNRFKIHVAGSKVIVDGQPRTGMVHCGLGRSTADWDGPVILVTFLEWFFGLYFY